MFRMTKFINVQYDLVYKFTGWQSLLMFRMTKCMFQKFGPSGTIEKLDALCVLGMNIINEKVKIINDEYVHK